MGQRIMDVSVKIFLEGSRLCCVKLLQYFVIWGCLEKFLPYWNYGHLESMNSNYTTDRQKAGMCADLTLLELKMLQLELVLKYVVFKIHSRVSKVFLGFVISFSSNASVPLGVFQVLEY